MSSKQPNVLWILADQQRADTLGALGNPIICTPNLDRLCADGLAFTSAYSPSPVCMSARCSMIYGQYPLHTGCYENTRMPEDDRPTVMAALTEAGYRTHGIGKCHFAPDNLAMRGFQSRQRQEEFSRNPEEDDYMQFLHDKGFSHVCTPHGIRGEMYYVPQPSQMPAELHPTQWVGDQAVQFIGAQAAGDQPWMCLTSFIHPAPPFSPPSPWHRMYRAPLMPMPIVPQDSESLQLWVNRHQNRYKYRDQGIDWNLVRCIKAYYYAAISFVDFQVGRILDELGRTGQIDDTLILFASDHGEYLGDYKCFGKRGMHDGSARVPLVLRLPGRFDGGKTCDRPVSLVDIAPTILAATGAALPADQLDGEDLAEVAAGTCPRRMVFSQHNRGSRATYMAVGRQWKYFYSAGDNRDFLFDRISDPGETRNRAGLRLCRDARKRMKQVLIDHLVAGGETVGLEAGDWRTYSRIEMPPDPDTGLLIADAPLGDRSIPGYRP